MNCFYRRHAIWRLGKCTERRLGECHFREALPPTVDVFYHQRFLSPFRAAIVGDWRLNFWGGQIEV